MWPSATLRDETVLLFSAQHQGRAETKHRQSNRLCIRLHQQGLNCQYQCVCITSHAQYASEVPSCKPELDATCNHIQLILSPGLWKTRAHPCSRPKLLPSGIIRLTTFPSYTHSPASCHRVLTMKTAHYTDYKERIFAVL